MDTLQDRRHCATRSRVSKLWAEPAEAQWGFKGVELCSQHVDELVSTSSIQQGRRKRTRNESRKEQQCFSKVKKQKKNRNKKWPCISDFFFAGRESGRMKSLSCSLSVGLDVQPSVSSSWQQLNAAWQASLACRSRPSTCAESLRQALVVVVALSFNPARHTHTFNTHSLFFTDRTPKLNKQQSLYHVWVCWSRRPTWWPRS